MCFGQDHTAYMMPIESGNAMAACHTSGAQDPPQYEASQYHFRLMAQIKKDQWYKAFSKGGIHVSALEKHVLNRLHPKPF
jgi:hypothetical protein